MWLYWCWIPVNYVCLLQTLLRQKIQTLQPYLRECDTENCHLEVWIDTVNQNFFKRTTPKSKNFRRKSQKIMIPPELREDFLWNLEFCIWQLAFCAGPTWATERANWENVNGLRFNNWWCLVGFLGISSIRWDMNISRKFRLLWLKIYLIFKINFIVNIALAKAGKIWRIISNH